MARHFYQYLLMGMSWGCLLLAAPQPVSATIVFDDHFDGDSGGMPAGWSLLLGTGSVVEEGTTVTITNEIGNPDDGTIIGSDSAIDPSVGTITIITDIAGTSGQVGSGVGSLPDPSCFIVTVRLSDGRIEAAGWDAEGGLQYGDVGYLSGYTGGPIRLTVVLGAMAFSISTDSPPFSSGWIDYTAFFPTFTREDLGSSAKAILGNWFPGASSIDRITVDVEGATAVESMTFGRIKALYRR